MMERLPAFLAFILGVCALAAADDTAPPQLVGEKNTLLQLSVQFY